MYVCIDCGVYRVRLDGLVVSAILEVLVPLGLGCRRLLEFLQSCVGRIWNLHLESIFGIYIRVLLGL